MCAALGRQATQSLREKLAGHRAGIAERAKLTSTAAKKRAAWEQDEQRGAKQKEKLSGVVEDLNSMAQCLGMSHCQVLQK